MSHAIPPSDLVQGSEPLDEDLLRRALAPKRPDADAFRRGIQRRINEQDDRKEAERRRQELRLVQAPERLRWAAGIVPVGLLPGTMGAASLAGKKLSAKALPALFALPVISLAMLAAAFFFGLRNVLRRPPVTGRMATAQEVTAQWWKRNLKLSIAIFVGTFLLVMFRHPEAITIGLTVSMVFVALILIELGRAGLADRVSIGRTMAGTLWSLGMYSIMFSSSDIATGGHAIFVHYLLFLGAAATSLLTHGISWPAIREKFAHPIRMEHPDPFSTWFLRGILWMGVALALTVGATFAYVAAISLSPASVTRNDLLEWIEDPKRRDNPLLEMREIIGTLDELARTEGRAPDLSHLLRTIEELGTEEREEYWAKSFAQELGLEPFSRQDPDRLTTWPAGYGPASLDDLLRRVRSLEKQGDADKVEHLREITLDFLSKCWTGDIQRRSWAGFDGLPELSGSLLGRFRSPGGYVVDTQAAVELMRRFGIPENVEIDRVRRLLEKEAKPKTMDFLMESPYGAHARLGLFQLDGFAPGQSSLRLYDYRGPIGALLMIGLCIFATARAPKEVAAQEVEQ